MKNSFLVTIFILALASGCLSTRNSAYSQRYAANESYGAEKPDVIFNSPKSTKWAVARTLHIVTITSEPEGAWVFFENDRLGKTPLKVGIYGTQDRIPLELINIQLKPTKEMEAALPANSFYFALNGEGRICISGCSFGTGTRIPRNLHLKLAVMDAEKVREGQKNNMNINVYHY